MIVAPGRFRVSVRSGAAGNHHDLSKEGVMKQTIDEISRLRGCINDLISVQALPAMWTGQEPAQIVSTLLDVLIGMLRLDFAYARLKDRVGEAPIEMLQLAQSRNLRASPQEIGQLLKPCLGDDPQKWPLLVRNPVGDGDVSIVPLRLGLRDEIGVIVAGSQRADFPWEAERLLLSVAANQAAIGLQEARLLSEQKRVARELDQRVAQRTGELAAANEGLQSEIIERRRVEEKLRQDERELRGIVDAIPLLIVVRGPDGTFLYANRSVLEYSGFTVDEVMAPEFRTQFVHPEDWARLHDERRQGLSRSVPFEIEQRLRHKDGQYRWFVVRYHPLCDDQGRILRWYATGIDIDERKRAEESMRNENLALREEIDRASMFEEIVGSSPALQR